MNFLFLEPCFLFLRKNAKNHGFMWERKKWNFKIRRRFKRGRDGSFQVGHGAKHGLGEITTNKAAVQYLRERAEKIVMETFANPQGGSERLTQIQDLLEKHILDETILISGGTRGLKIWVADFNGETLIHLILKHSEAKEHGIVWYLWLDEADGRGFEHLKIRENKFSIVSVDTQNADGYASRVKLLMNNNDGVRREHV